MKITTDGVFLIKAFIIDLEEVVKTILIHLQNHKYLWLVVEFQRPETNQNPRYTYTKTDGRLLCKRLFSADNLVLDDDSTNFSRIGRISNNESVKIYRENLTSSESMKLKKLLTQRTTGVSFWINFNPSIGSLIPSMCHS